MAQQPDAPEAVVPDRHRTERFRQAVRRIVLTSRPGFWSTHLWFYLLPLGTHHVLDEWSFWLGAIYVMLPLGHVLYGWNDLTDFETDAHNPRKGTWLSGARLTRAELRVLPLHMLAIQAPFVVVFVWIAGPRMLLWFALSAVVNLSYNNAPLRLKSRPGLDLVNQSGYLLVFLLSSWVNHVPQLPWQAFLFGALFAMHSHLVGQIADLEPDRLAGRRTTAVAIGPVAAKALIAGLLLAEAGLVQIAFASPPLALFLAIAGFGFLADAVLRGERTIGGAWLRVLLLGWNATAVLSMFWVWQTGVFVR